MSKYFVKKGRARHRRDKNRGIPFHHELSRKLHLGTRSEVEESENGKKGTVVLSDLGPAENMNGLKIEKRFYKIICSKAR